MENDPTSQQDFNEAARYAMLLNSTGQSLNLGPSIQDTGNGFEPVEAETDDDIYNFYQNNMDLGFDLNDPDGEAKWKRLTAATSKRYTDWAELISNVGAEVASVPGNVIEGFAEGGLAAGLGGTAEGVARSIRDMVGMFMYSENPDSPIFWAHKTIRALTTGKVDDWKNEAATWNAARRFTLDSELLRRGDESILEHYVDMDDETARKVRSFINPKVAHSMSFIGLELPALLMAPFTGGASQALALEASASRAVTAAANASRAGVYAKTMSALDNAYKRFENFTARVTQNAVGRGLGAAGRALEIPARVAEGVVGSNIERLSNATGFTSQHIRNAATTAMVEGAGALGGSVGPRQTVGFLGSLGLQSTSELAQAIGAEMVQKSMGLVDASLPSGLTILERVAANPNLSKTAKMGAKVLNAVVDPMIQLSTEALKRSYKDGLTFAALGYLNDKERGAVGGAVNGMVWGGMSGALRHTWSITNGALTHETHIKNFDENYLPSFIDRTNTEFGVFARKLIADVDGFKSSRASSNVRSVIQTLWSALDSGDKKSLLAHIGTPESLQKALEARGVAMSDIQKYKQAKGAFYVETLNDKQFPVIFLDQNKYRAADAAHEAMGHALVYSLITKGKAGEHMMQFFGREKNKGIVSDDVITHLAAKRRSSEEASIAALAQAQALGIRTHDETGKATSEFLSLVNRIAREIYEGSAAIPGSKLYYQHWIDQARTQGNVTAGWWLSSIPDVDGNNVPAPYTIGHTYVDSTGAKVTESPIKYIFEEAISGQSEAMFIHTNLQDIVLPDELKPFRMSIERMQTNRMARIVTEMELAGFRAKYADAFDANGNPTIQLEVYDDGKYIRNPDMEGFFKNFVRDAINHDAQGIRFLTPAAQAAEAKLHGKEFLFNFNKAGANMKGTKEINDLLTENAKTAMDALEAMDPQFRPNIVVDAYGNRSVDMMTLGDEAFDALHKSGALDAESVRIAKAIRDSHLNWEKSGYASPNMFYGVYWGDSHRTEKNGFFKRLLGRDVPVTNRVFVPYELRLSYRTTDDSGKPLRSPRGGVLTTVVDYMAIHRRKMRLWQRPDVRSTFVSLETYNAAFDEYMLNMMKDPSSRKTTVELFRTQFPGNAEKVRDILYETFGGSIRKDETYINPPREGYSSSHENPNYPIHSMRVEMLVGVEQLSTKPFPYHHGNSYEPLRRNLSLAGFEKVGLSDGRYHNGQGYEMFKTGAGWKLFSPFGGVIGIFKTLEKATAAVTKDMKKIDKADILPLPTESEWASMNRSERLRYMSEAGRAFHKSSFGMATDAIGTAMKSLVSIGGDAWTPELDTLKTNSEFKTLSALVDDYVHGRADITEIESSFELKDFLTDNSISELQRWWKSNGLDEGYDFRNVSILFKVHQGPSAAPNFKTNGQLFSIIGGSATRAASRGTGFGIAFDIIQLKNLPEEQRNRVILEGIKSIMSKSVLLGPHAKREFSLYSIGQQIRKPDGISVSDHLTNVSTDIALLNHVKDLQNKKVSAPEPEVVRAIEEFKSEFFGKFGDQQQFNLTIQDLLSAKNLTSPGMKEIGKKASIFRELRRIIFNKNKDAVLKAKGLMVLQALKDFGDGVANSTHEDYFMVPSTSVRTNGTDGTVGLQYVNMNRSITAALVDLFSYLNTLGDSESNLMIRELSSAWSNTVDHASVQIHEAAYVSAAASKLKGQDPAVATYKDVRGKSASVINPDAIRTSVAGQGVIMLKFGKQGEAVTVLPNISLAFRWQTGSRTRSGVIGQTEVPTGEYGYSSEVRYPFYSVPADWAIKSGMVDTISVADINGGMHLKWLATEIAALAPDLDVVLQKIIGGKGKDLILGKRELTKAEALMELVLDRPELTVLMERAQATLGIERAMDEGTAFEQYRNYLGKDADSAKKDADFERYQKEVLIMSAIGSWHVSAQLYSALGHTSSTLSSNLDTIAGRRIYAELWSDRAQKDRAEQLVQKMRKEFSGFGVRQPSKSLVGIESLNPERIEEMRKVGLLKQYAIRGSKPKLMFEISDRDSYIDYSSVNGEPHLLPFVGSSDPEKAFSNYSATVRRLASNTDGGRIYLSKSTVIGTTTLGKIFGHEDLYYNFPEARDIRVVFKDFHGARYVPAHGGKAPVIEIGARTFTADKLSQQGVDDMQSYPSLDNLRQRFAESNTAVGVLVHEVQHALQDAAGILPEHVELKMISSEFMLGKLVKLLGGEVTPLDRPQLETATSVSEILKRSNLPVYDSFREGAVPFIRTVTRNMAMFAMDEYHGHDAIDAVTLERFLHASEEAKAISSPADGLKFWRDYTKLMDEVIVANPRYFATFWDDPSHRAAVTALGMTSTMERLLASDDLAANLVRVRRIVDQYSTLDYLTDAAEVMAYETSRRRGLDSKNLIRSERTGPEDSVLRLIDTALSETAYGRDELRADIDRAGIGAVMKSIGGIESADNDNAALASLGKLGLMRWFMRKATHELTSLNKLFLYGIGWEIGEDGKLVLTNSKYIISSGDKSVKDLIDSFNASPVDALDKDLFDRLEIVGAPKVRQSSETGRAMTYTLGDILRLANVTLEAESVFSVGNRVIDLVNSDRFPSVVEGKNIIPELKKLGDYSENAANAVMLNEIAFKMPDFVFTKNDLLNLFTFAHSNIFTSAAVSGFGSGELPKVKDAPSRDSVFRALRNLSKATDQPVVDVIKYTAKIDSVVQSSHETKLLGMMRYKVSRGTVTLTSPSWVSSSDWSAFIERFNNTELGKKIRDFNSGLTSAEIEAINNRLIQLAPLVEPAFQAMRNRMVELANQESTAESTLYRGAFMDAAMSEMAEQTHHIALGVVSSVRRLEETTGIHTFKAMAGTTDYFDLNYVSVNQVAINRLGLSEFGNNLLGYGGGANRGIGNHNRLIDPANNEVIGDVPTALTLAFGGHIVDPSGAKSAVTVSSVETGAGVILGNLNQQDGSTYAPHADEFDQPYELGSAIIKRGPAVLAEAIYKANSNFAESASLTLDHVSQQYQGLINELTNVVLPTHAEGGAERDSVLARIADLKGQMALASSLASVFSDALIRRNLLTREQSVKAISSYTGPIGSNSVLPSSPLGNSASHDFSALHPGKSTIGTAGVFGMKLSDGRLVVGAESYFANGPGKGLVTVNSAGTVQMPEGPKTVKTIKSLRKAHAISSMLFQITSDAPLSFAPLDRASLDSATGGVQRMGRVSDALLDFYANGAVARLDRNNVDYELFTRDYGDKAINAILDGSGLADIGSLINDLFTAPEGQTPEAYISQNSARLRNELGLQFSNDVPAHLNAQTLTIGAAFAPFVYSFIKDGRLVDVDGMAFLDVIFGDHPDWNNLLNAARDLVNASNAEQKIAAVTAIQDLAVKLPELRESTVTNLISGLLNQQMVSSAISSIGAMSLHEKAKRTREFRGKNTVSSGNLALAIGAEHVYAGLTAEKSGVGHMAMVRFKRLLEKALSEGQHKFFTGVALAMAAHEKNVVSGVVPYEHKGRGVGRAMPAEHAPGTQLSYSSSNVPIFQRLIGFGESTELPGDFQVGDMWYNFLGADASISGTHTIVGESRPSLGQTHILEHGRDSLSNSVIIGTKSNVLSILDASAEARYDQINYLSGEGFLTSHDVVPARQGPPESYAGWNTLIPVSFDSSNYGQFTSGSITSVANPYKTVTSAIGAAAKRTLIRNQIVLAASAVGSNSVSIQPARIAASPRAPTILATAGRTDSAERIAGYVIQHAMGGTYPMVAFNELTRPQAGFSWSRMEDGRILVNFSPDVNFQGLIDGYWGRSTANVSNVGINLLRTVGWDVGSSESMMAPFLRSGFASQAILHPNRGSRFAPANIGTAIFQGMKYMPFMDDAVVGRHYKRSAARSFREMAIGSVVHSTKLDEHNSLNINDRHFRSAEKVLSEITNQTGLLSDNIEVVMGMDGLIAHRTPGFGYLSFILPKDFRPEDITTAVASYYGAFLTSDYGKKTMATMPTQHIAQAAYNLNPERDNLLTKVMRMDLGDESRFRSFYANMSGRAAMEQGIKSIRGADRDSVHSNEILKRTIQNLAVLQPRLFEDLDTLVHRVSGEEGGYFLPDAERSLALHGDVSAAIDLIFPGRKDLKQYSWDAASAMGVTKFKGSDKKWVVSHDAPRVTTDGARTVARVMRKFGTESEANSYIATISSHGSSAELIQAIRDGDAPLTSETVPSSSLRVPFTRSLSANPTSMLMNSGDKYAVGNIDKLFDTKEAAQEAKAILTRGDVMTAKAPARTQINLSIDDLTIGEMEGLLRNKASFGLGASPITFIPRILRVLGREKNYAPGRVAKEVMTGTEWYKLLKFGKINDHELRVTGVVELLYAFKDLPLHKRDVAMFVYANYPTTGRHDYYVNDRSLGKREEMGSAGPLVGTPKAHHPFTASRIYGRRMINLIKAQIDSVEKAVAAIPDQTPEASVAVAAKESLIKIHQEALLSAYEQVASKELLMRAEETLGIKDRPVMEKIETLFGQLDKSHDNEGGAIVGAYIMEAYRRNLNNLVESSKATSLAALSGINLHVGESMFLDNAMPVHGPEDWHDESLVDDVDSYKEINRELGFIHTNNEDGYSSYTSGVGRYWFEALYADVDMDPLRASEYKASIKERINRAEAAAAKDEKAAKELESLREILRTFERVQSIRSRAVASKRDSGHKTGKRGTMQLGHLRLGNGLLASSKMPSDTFADFATDLKGEDGKKHAIPTLIAEELQSDTYQKATFGNKELAGDYGLPASFEELEAQRELKPQLAALAASAVKQDTAVATRRDAIYEVTQGRYKSAFNALTSAAVEQSAIKLIESLGPASIWALRKGMSEARSYTVEDLPFIDTGRKAKATEALKKIGFPDEFPVYEFVPSTDKPTRDKQIQHVNAYMNFSGGLNQRTAELMRAIVADSADVVDAAFASELEEPKGSTFSSHVKAVSQVGEMGNALQGMALTFLAVSDIPQKAYFETASAALGADSVGLYSIVPRLDFDAMGLRALESLEKAVEKASGEVFESAFDAIHDGAMTEMNKRLFKRENIQAMRGFLLSKSTSVTEPLVGKNPIGEKQSMAIAGANHFEYDWKRQDGGRHLLTVNEYAETQSFKTFKTMKNVLKSTGIGTHRLFLKTIYDGLGGMAPRSVESIPDIEILNAFQAAAARYVDRNGNFLLSAFDYARLNLEFAKRALGITSDQFIQSLLKREEGVPGISRKLEADDRQSFEDGLRSLFVDDESQAKTNAAGACYWGQSTFWYPEDYINLGEKGGRLLSQVDSEGDKCNGSFCGYNGRFAIPVKTRSRTVIGAAMELAFAAMARAKIISTGLGDKATANARYKDALKRLRVDWDEESGGPVDYTHSDTMAFAYENAYRNLFAVYLGMRAIQNGQRAVTVMDARHHRNRYHTVGEFFVLANLGGGRVKRMSGAVSTHAMTAAYALELAKAKGSNGNIIRRIQEEGLGPLESFEHAGATLTMAQHLQNAVNEILPELPLGKSAKEIIHTFVGNAFSASSIPASNLKLDEVGDGSLRARLAKVAAKPFGIMQYLPTGRNHGYNVNYGSPHWMNRMFYAGGDPAEQLRLSHDAFEKFSVIKESDGSYSVYNPAGKAVFTKIDSKFKARELAAQSAKYLGAIPYMGAFMKTYKPLGAYAMTGLMQGSLIRNSEGVISSNSQFGASTGLVENGIGAEATSERFSQIENSLEDMHPRSGLASMKQFSKSTQVEHAYFGMDAAEKKFGEANSLSTGRAKFVSNLDMFGSKVDESPYILAVGLHALGITPSSSPDEVAAAVKYMIGNTGPTMVIRPMFPTPEHDAAFAKMIVDGLPLLSLDGLSNETKRDASIRMYKGLGPIRSTADGEEGAR